jgi:hypothetical protein
MLDLFNILATLLLLCVFLFSGLGIYWLWFDTAPIILYGPNGRSEFKGDRVIFHLDATRLRACPATIHRKISGCGQVDLPDSIATTEVGKNPPPVSFPLEILFQHFSKEQLSGNVCTMVSIAEGYCNPAQAFFKMPIRSVSQPIQFIPVPRAKTFEQP